MILGFFPRLEWLVLSHCKRITDVKMLHSLLDNLPALSKLYLTGTVS